jgi:glycosyltransferase involved in cell wall biosynthesis
MANYWACKGWHITMLTLDDGSASPCYDLDSRVHHIPLDIAGDSINQVVGCLNNLRRIHRLRHTLHKISPDVVVSFVDKTNVITLLATLGMKLRVIVSERSDPAVYRIGRVWEQLRWLTYMFADGIVVQNTGALAYFQPRFHGRTTVIPNPVVKPPVGEHQVTRSQHSHSVIAMGRLSQEKRFDLLLLAFAQLKERHPNWNLTILGEGPLRQVLESLRDQLGLTSRVFLLGYVRNTYYHLEKADLFVMCSRFEGFPNALCEAMACGLPVISTDCPSGPREIIRGGENGLLVQPEDVNVLALAMDSLMSDEKERKRLGSRAVEVIERFSLEKIMRMWEEVLGASSRHELLEPKC